MKEPNNIDKLLAKQVIEPSPDFTEATLQRLEREKASDLELEKLLKASPIEPSADFAAKTLSRLEEKEARLLHFPAPAWVGAGMVAAAAIALIALVAVRDTVQKPAVQIAQSPALGEVEALEYQELIELEEDLAVFEDLEYISYWEPIQSLE